MATALLKRVTDRPSCSLFRQSSYTLFQNLSTSAPTPAPDPPVSSNNPKRKEKKKKRSPSFYPIGESDTTWPRLIGRASLTRSPNSTSTRMVGTEKLGEWHI
ncbi:unnamed protein product [Rhodiola kirilowii]